MENNSEQMPLFSAHASSYVDSRLSFGFGGCACVCMLWQADKQFWVARSAGPYSTMATRLLLQAGGAFVDAVLCGSCLAAGGGTFLKNVLFHVCESMLMT